MLIGAFGYLLSTLWLTSPPSATFANCNRFHSSARPPDHWYHSFHLGNFPNETCIVPAQVIA